MLFKRCSRSLRAGAVIVRSQFKIGIAREKAEAFRNDEKYLKEVMQKGAEKATKSANATMERVREAMGLKYF